MKQKAPFILKFSTKDGERRSDSSDSRHQHDDVRSGSAMPHRLCEIRFRSCIFRKEKHVRQKAICCGRSGRKTGRRSWTDPEHTLLYG